MALLRNAAVAITVCCASLAFDDVPLCEDDVGVPRFQLLQRSLSVMRGVRLDGRAPGRLAEWVGKNGNAIRRAGCE